jgi:ATP-binding cassette subfamily B protein
MADPFASAEPEPPVKFTRETLRDAWQLAGYLRPYRGLYILAIVCLLIANVTGLAFPFAIGRLIDGTLHGLQPGAEELAWYQRIDGIALILLGILAADALLSFADVYLFQLVSQSCMADLRRDTFGRLLRLPLGFHHRHRVGELTSRLVQDLSHLEETFVHALPDLLKQLGIAVGAAVLILITSVKLTVFMVASVSVMALLAIVFGRVIRRYSKDTQDKLAASNVVVEESLQGIATVKAFTGEKAEESRYATTLTELVQIAMRTAVARGLFTAFVVFALFGAIVAVMWFGAGMVQRKQLTLGELTTFLLYTVYVNGALGSFAEIYSRLQKSLGATQRVRDILREPEETGGEGSSTTTPMSGEVELRDVRFRYPTRPEVGVLAGVSLVARPGERIALVGPSGAGKSTILALVLRFYDPESGTVLIDGRDVRDYPLEKLRSHMAIVPQDVILFGGTIAENITYGKPGATVGEIEMAARQANAHEFIVGFPDGYQTKVGERGVQLSGGQRQRVAIARAILRDPRILLLDEATSSLDLENEALVLQALDRLMEGRTCLVVAHRLSTVRQADRIYVLQDGTIQEAGTHEELSGRLDGVYRRLAELY